MDNPIIMVILGIQCICNLLQLIVLIAILIKLFISDTSRKSNTSAALPASNAPQLSSLEQEELRRQRKKFDDEMEAFQEMLNYSADVAYGINKETSD